MTTFSLSHFADDSVCDVTCTTDFISTLNCSNSDLAGTASCYIVVNCRYRSSTSCSYFESCQSGMCWIILLNHYLNSLLVLFLLLNEIGLECVVMFSRDETDTVEGNCSITSSQSWCTIDPEELQLMMEYDTNCSITTTQMTKQGGAETPTTKNMTLHKSSKWHLSVV